MSPRMRFFTRDHPVDEAIDAVIKLFKRRDAYVLAEVVAWHDRGPSLGALVWAACGKLNDVTPSFMLEQISHHARIVPGELDVSGIAPTIIGRRIREA